MSEKYYAKCFKMKKGNKRLIDDVLCNECFINLWFRFEGNTLVFWHHTAMNWYHFNLSWIAIHPILHLNSPRVKAELLYHHIL